MQWLISDIHGQMQDFTSLLSKIKFNREEDKMIIMGDIVDRGPQGIELLDYINPYVEEGSMELLLGNHEIFMMMYLKGTLSAEKWIRFGGRDTLSKLTRLTKAQKEKALNMLESCSLYKEIYSPRYGNSVVTHTGVDRDYLADKADGTIDVKLSIENALLNNMYYFMVGTDIHNLEDHVLKKFDQFLFVGHVPCFRLNTDISNRFLRTPYYMDLDAGAGYKIQGGTLACYCVDTDEEIYCC